MAVCSIPDSLIRLSLQCPALPLASPLVRQSRTADLREGGVPLSSHGLPRPFSGKMDV
jgi:hypothetical protein